MCNEIEEAFGFATEVSLLPPSFSVLSTLNDPTHHDLMRTNKSRSTFVTWYKSRVARKED